MSVPLLAVADIWKTFDDQVVLRGISFELAAGQILALLGPSGCGKSTLLRIITGLEHADRGALWLEGQPLAGMPVHKRGFGLMFQDWALFPHRTVGENIAFGLRMQRQSRQAVQVRVAAMLELVGLRGYAQRSIFELSGGERQRVALARALAPKPRLLLLDEPLGSLDRTLRERLTDELRTIITSAGVTAIYVTHDQVEAFTIADQLLLMQQGQIAQRGSGPQIYDQPASPFVARFLSLNNLLACTGWQASAAAYRANTVLGPLELARAPQQPELPQLVLIRPEAATLDPASPNQLRGTVERTTFRGSSTRIHWRHSSGTLLELDIAATAVPAPGGVLSLGLHPQQLRFVPATDAVSAAASDQSDSTAA